MISCWLNQWGKPNIIDVCRLVSTFVPLFSFKVDDHSLNVYDHSLKIYEILHLCKISQLLRLSSQLVRLSEHKENLLGCSQ